jgi:tetratricopeptide (TPR) repeat protein
MIRLGQFDLSAVLKAALPGVYAEEDQKKRLIGRVVNGEQTENAMADNPRYLDEFLKMLYQDANLQFLVDRDIDKRLIDNWEQKIDRKLGGLGYKRLIQNRFDQLDSSHRNTLCWSSYQGIEFPEKLTEAISINLNEGVLACPWQTLEDPETFIQRNSTEPGGVSRFPDSVCRSVAYESLDADSKDALKKLLQQFLCFWLFYEKFDDDLEEVNANQAEEKILCEIALKVFENTNYEYADAATAIALAQLLRINIESHNPEETLNTAERFASDFTPSDIIENVPTKLIQIVIGALLDYGRIKLAEKILLPLVEFQREAVERSPAYVNFQGLVISLDLSGRAAKKRGDNDTAICFYEEALSIARDLVKEFGTQEALHDLSASLDKIGDMAATSGHHIAATNAYEEAMTISRKLDKKFDMPGALRGVSISLNKIGDMADMRGDYDAAVRAYEEALTIDRKRVEQLGTTDALRGVSISLSKIGNMAVGKGDYDSGARAYEEVLTIDRELVERIGTPKVLRYLSLSLLDIGDIAVKKNDYGAATLAYDEAITINRNLVKQFSIPEALRWLSISLNKIGDLAVKKSDIGAAARAYEEALTIDHKRVDQFGTPQALRELSISLEKAANIAVTKGDYDAAVLAYEESLKIRRDLVEQLGTSQALREMSISLEKIGSVAITRGDDDAAACAYEELLRIMRELVDHLGTSDALCSLSISLDRIGYVSVRRGDHDAAARYYGEALTISRKLAKKLGTDEALRDLSILLQRNGYAAATKGDNDSARHAYEELLTIREKLNTPADWRNVIENYTNLGKLCPRQGWWQKAFEVCERLASEGKLAPEDAGMLEDLRQRATEDGN